MLELQPNIKQDILEEYLNYMCKRNVVGWQKLEGGDVDYNGDATLRDYKFMNIWRELDAFSQEEIKRLRGKTFIEQLELILLARYTLSWNTFDFMVGNRNTLTLEKLREFKETVEARDMLFMGDAIEHEGEDICQDLWHFWLSVRNPAIKQLADYILTDVSGHSTMAALQYFCLELTPFRAYEVTTSLTYTASVLFNEDTFFHVGPGALPAIELLHELDRPPESLLIAMQSTIRGHLNGLPGWKWIRQVDQGDSGYLRTQRFTLRNLEDSLCEFRKYYQHNHGIRQHRRPRVS